MAKYVEIGALVAKGACDKAYTDLYSAKGVEYVTVETGRSNDLFSDRQFGEFGEAAILTIIAEVKQKDAVLAKIYQSLGAGEKPVGLIYEERPLAKFKTYF